MEPILLLTYTFIITLPTHVSIVCRLSLRKIGVIKMKNKPLCLLILVPWYSYGSLPISIHTE